MDISGMVNRAKGLLLAPQNEWPLINEEKAGQVKVLLSWLLPLSLIPAVAAFIGYALIGSSVGFGIYLGSVSWGIKMAVLRLVLLIGGACITAFIVNALAEKNASEKNQDQAFALVAYSYTPICLGGIFNIIPSLAPLGLLVGLYGLYLLYVGQPPMMKTPQDKTTGYFVVSLICAIVVHIVLGTVLGAILLRRL